MSEVERDPLEAARARKAHAFKVFIYCDDPSHPRRVAVTNFIALPDGGWHEEPASRVSTGHVGTGYHLLEDTPATTGWALDPEVSNAQVRANHDLPCRKCKGQGRGTLTVRSEKLYPVLDGWRASGVSEVPLTLVAASLGRSNNQNPERGQG